MNEKKEDEILKEAKELKKKERWISNICWIVGGLAVIGLAYCSVMVSYGYGNPLIGLATGIALVILYSLLIKRYRKK